MIPSRLAPLAILAAMLLVFAAPASSQASSIIYGLTGDTPAGIAINSSGNIYTTNNASDNVSEILPGGASSIFAPAAQSPFGIVIDPAGNVYTANSVSDDVSKITPDGTSTILGTTGNFPVAIAVDSAGNIYTPNTISANVSKITPAGVSTTNWAATGSLPSAITVDSAGNLYTANGGSNNVSKITPGGVPTIIGATGADPVGITIDSVGNLYTANYGSHTVSQITPNWSPNIFPAPPAKPAAPTAAVGSPGSGTATITVTANPVSAVFGTPASYTMSATQDSSKQCIVVIESTSCSVTGLTIGATYTFSAQANLHSWQTASSLASNSVTPAPGSGGGGSGGGGSGGGGSGGGSEPSNLFTVTKAKAKVTRSSMVLTTRVKVPGAGKIIQAATTKKGSKLTTRCKAAKTTSDAATYTLTSKIGKAGRGALRKAKMTLTVRTTFTPTGGTLAAKTQTVKLVRRG